MESGTHTSLLAKGGVYANLVNMHLSRENDGNENSDKLDESSPNIMELENSLAESGMSDAMYFL